MPRPLTLAGTIKDAGQVSLPARKFCLSLISMSVRVTLFILALLAVGALADIPRRSYVASFGSNESKRLGRPSSGLPTVKLTCPKQRCGVRQFSVANSYVIVDTALGDYAWGSNAAGQLPGLAQTTDDIAPTLVPQVTASTDNTYVVLDDACLMNGAGTTYGYGSNTKGQLAAVGQSAWAVSPAAAPVVPITAPAVAPISKRSVESLNSEQSALDSQETRETSDSVATDEIAAPPPFTNTEYGTLSFTPELLRCAATRCYYLNSSSHTWGYWGNADYDPDYDFTTTPLRRLDVTPAVGISYIVHSRTMAVMSTLTGVQAMGFFLNSTDPLIAQPPTVITPACQVRSRLPSLAIAMDVGDGFVVYVCNDSRTMYAFGNNTFGQLGNASITDSYVPGIIDSQSSVSSHALVSMQWNNPTEIIVDISAGMASTYILTSAGDVYAWGYTGSSALGIETDDMIAAGHMQFVPVLLSYYSTVKNTYASIAIRSTASAHGVFVGLAMRPGTIGTTCVTLPTTVTSLFNISDSNSIFCDVEGYYNLNTMSMVEQEDALVSVVMKIRGDMSMTGSSKMASIGGMTLEGDITLNDTAIATIAGTMPDSANIVDGALYLYDRAQARFQNTTVQVTGDVQLSANAAITFSNLTDSLLNDSSVVVNVTGAVYANGVVNVVVTQKDIDALVAAALNGAGKRSAEADSPSSATVNTTLTTVLVSSEQGIITSGTTITNLTVAQPSDACAKSSGSLVPSSGSLALVVSISIESDCSNNDNVLGGSPTNAGIIAGSVVGGVLAAFVLIAIIILAVPALRQRVLPYRDASARRATTTAKYQAASEEP